MASTVGAAQKSIKERVWDITQALVAGLLFAAISGGTAYLYGLGDSHRDLSARVDVELERIDRELDPINGKSRRDIIIQTLNEMEHWKSRGHRLEAKVETMEKGFHQEVEAVARFSAEIKSKCDLIEQRCEYYRREMERK